MIDLMVELMLSAVVWLLLASWRALPLFLLVWIFNFATRNIVAPKYHCLLWGLVLMRLVMPFSVESSLSMHQKTESVLAALGFVNKSSIPDAQQPYVQQAGKQSSGAQLPPSQLDETKLFSKADSRTTANVPSAWQASDFEPQAHAQAEVVYTESTPVGWSLGIIEIVVLAIICIWPLGTIFMLSRSAIRYLRFSLRLRKCKLVEDQRVVDLILRTCDQLGLGKRPKIKVVPGLNIPAIFGFFRPTICLPESALALADKELQLVFAHEVAHAKRRDPLVLILADIVRALQWVNPISWFTYTRLQASIEQAADSAVIRKQNAHLSKEYAQLLLNFSKLPAKSLKGAATGLLFSSPGNQLKRRIQLMQQPHDRHRWISRILAVAAIVSLAFTGLTDSMAEVAPVPEKKINIPRFTTFDPTPSSVALSSASQESLGESIEKTYDISDAITSIERLNDVDGAVAALEEWLMPLERIGPSIKDWKELGEISTEGNSLKVLAPEKIHQSIEDQLDVIARAGLCQIVIDWHVVECPLEFVKKLNLDWAIHDEPNNRESGQHFGVRSSDFQAVEAIEGFSQRTLMPSGPPILSSQVPTQTMEELLGMCSGNAASNVMQLPRVTLFNGQTASVQDQFYRPFVTNVNFDEDSADLRPVIDILAEGLRIDFHAEVSSQDNTSLRCKFIRSNILDVDMANLPLGTAEQTVTVQVPRAIQDETTLHCKLGTSEGILVACPVPFSKEETKGPAITRLFLVTANILREAD